MTLRELLKTSDMEDVISYINSKYDDYICETDRQSLEQTDISYSAVIIELLSLPSRKPYKYSIVIKIESDPIDGKRYPSVLHLNHKYVKPVEGLLPYFPSKGKRVPKGYFNANSDKYNQYFAFGYVDWAKIIDTSIVIEESAKELPMYAVLGEILWELTFNGWTREQNNYNNKNLIERLDNIMKNIESK